MTSVAVRKGVATSADAALVRRAANGDAAAFDALVASRLDRCFRLAWAILANDSDAADATQDAFVAAWRHLPRLRDPGAFDPWLNRIVANAARMARRQRVRLREVSIAPIPSENGGADLITEIEGRGAATLEEVVERDAIGRAFDRLRPDERAILVLHHVEERPVDEIARSLGIPGGTAKWRLHAARRALEREIGAEQ
jgi:RNA polymerase sigma-70 factor (ECF subfamily)